MTTAQIDAPRYFNGVRNLDSPVESSQAQAYFDLVDLALNGSPALKSRARALLEKRGECIGLKFVDDTADEVPHAIGDSLAGA